MTSRYAVFGNPVAHSVSPRIHAAFAKQTGHDLSYDKMEVPLDGLDAAVDDFFAAGGKGLNITLPFKAQAFECADHATVEACDAGAVNTLWRESNDTLVGANTDGVGFIRDLTVNQRASLAGRRVLLLGAGGAARGILGPLLQARPAHVHIANRTAARATALAARHPGNVTGAGLDDWPADRFDLVINASAAGHDGATSTPPPDLLGATCVCYDLSYGHAAAAFLDWARTHGAARALEGWGMLVEQAAESFHLWRGVRPETAAIVAHPERYRYA